MNRLSFLAVSDEGKESWDFLSTLFCKVCLKKLKKSFNGDLKLLNEVLGLMTASSAHPCCYCDWHKEKIGKFGPYNLRTFEEIREHAKKWKESGSKRSNAKFFKCCIKNPIDFFPETGLVLDYVAIPELHLMEGVVNKLFQELSLIWDGAWKWPEVPNMLFRKFTFHFF